MRCFSRRCMGVDETRVGAARHRCQARRPSVMARRLPESRRASSDRHRAGAADGRMADGSLRRRHRHNCRWAHRDDCFGAGYRHGTWLVDCDGADRAGIRAFDVVDACLHWCTCEARSDDVPNRGGGALGTALLVAAFQIGVGAPSTSQAALAGSAFVHGIMAGLRMMTLLPAMGSLRSEPVELALPVDDEQSTAR